MSLARVAHTPDERVGRVVAAVLKLQGVSHTRFAEALDMPPQTLSSKLRGSRPWRESEVAQVADALEVPPEMLMESPEMLLKILIGLHSGEVR